MRAWYLEDSPGEYRLGSVPEPAVGPRAGAGRGVASARNHNDTWVTRGLPRPKRFPHVPGADGAGIVDSTGTEVVDWKPGDEVVCNAAVTSAEAIDRLGIDSPFDPSLQLLGEHRWGTHGDMVVVPDHARAGRRAAPGRSARPIRW
ncbi:MAG: alcohol dehydrogenase catalytic domain-containing protein [Microthrixaceae bacterium]